MPAVGASLGADTDRSERARVGVVIVHSPPNHQYIHHCPSSTGLPPYHPRNTVEKHTPVHPKSSMHPAEYVKPALLPTRSGGSAVTLAPLIAHFPTRGGPEPPSAMAEPTPRLTQDAIQAARAAFARHVVEAEATVDGLPFDDIVIARNVTRDQLERVPSEWLRGVKVLLRADGSLLITNLRTHQHHKAVVELTHQLINWTRVNGLDVGHERSLTHDGTGTVRIPDVQVYETRGPLDPTRDALALFEVQVPHRSMPEIVATASEYLRNFPTVERVVFLKFYPLHQGALADDYQLLVPAIAVVFRRVANGTGRIEVAQMMSFGNATVDGLVWRSNQHPNPEFEDFDIQDRHRAPARWLPAPFALETLEGDLMALRTLRVEQREILNVEMPRGLTAIKVDLVEVFVDAMLGWCEDPAGVQAYQFLRVSTAAGRYGTST